MFEFGSKLILFGDHAIAIRWKRVAQRCLLLGKRIEIGGVIVGFLSLH